MVFVVLAAWSALGGVDLAVRLVRSSRNWLMSDPRRTLFEHIFEWGLVVMIQIEADTWIVMREHALRPKAVIQGFRNTAGEARFMVLIWDPIRSKRRLVDVHETLQAAEDSVPWPTGPTGDGYAGATFDRAEQARKIAERAAVKRAQRG